MSDLYIKKKRPTFYFRERKKKEKTEKQKKRKKKKSRQVKTGIYVHLDKIGS